MKSDGTPTIKKNSILRFVLKQIKDHALKGNWRGYREFHPARYGNYGKNYDNWIVIYQLDHDELILLLVATGSHEILNQ